MVISITAALADPTPTPTPTGKADFTGPYQSQRPDGTWQIEVVDMRTGRMGFIIRMSPEQGPIPDVTIVKPYDARLFFEANLNIRKEGPPPQ